MYIGESQDTKDTRAQRQKMFGSYAVYSDSRSPAAELPVMWEGEALVSEVWFSVTCS